MLLQASNPGIYLRSAGKLTLDGETSVQKECSAGQYVTNTLDCSSCPSGKYHSLRSLSWPCKNCEVGRYGVGGSSSDRCTAPCPAGRYGNITGQTNEQCTGPCPAGRYGTAGSSTSQCTGACVAGRYGIVGQTTDQCSGPCKPGRYGFAGSTNDECTGECSAGQYSAAGSGQCSICEPGFYNDKAGQEVCNKTCASGKYSLQGFDRCVDCQVGKVVNDSLGYPTANCGGSCGTGKYRDASSITCKDCEAGRYSNELATGACKSCEAGYVNPSTGQTSCTTRCSAGTYSLTGASNCIDCPVGKKINAADGYSSNDCGGSCGTGKYRDASSITCKDCEAGRYSNELGLGFCKLCPPGNYNNQTSQTSCDIQCPIGTYSSEGSTRCQKCIGGFKGTKTGAISSEDGCEKCPQGRYSSDVGGHSTCTECKLFGTFCPAGAIKPELCSSDKFCNGGTMLDRPSKPTDVIVQRVRSINAINVTWKVVVSGSDDETFHVLYTTRKDTPLMEMKKIEIGYDKRIRFLSEQEIDYHAVIRNLRVGTNYFVRIIRVKTSDESVQVESQPSELSDKVELQCPDGAYCGSPGGSGVLVNETRNLQGYFRVDNLTFVKCEVSANCPGVVTDTSGEAIPQNITANHCPKGYRGLMCLKCEKNYSRQSDSCNKCGDPAGQIAIAFLTVVAGILMFTYLIYKTIKGKGSPKDDQSGIIKIVLRQFQLLGIIASFPFSWTEEVTGIFNVFSSVANAGTEAFSFDCITEASYRTDATMNLVVPLLVLAFFWSLILMYFRSDVHIFTSLRTPIRITNAFCVRYLTLSAIVIMIQLHPGLVRQVLAFFQCIPVQQLGKSFLAADIDITCGSPEHDSMLTSLAIPALLLYIIGIPLTAVILLFKNRHNLDEEETRETLGFLYANYHIPYWEVVVIGRLVMLATISVVYESNPSMQATLGLQILFVSLIAHVLNEPFTSKSLNLVETYSLATSVLSLSCGSLLLGDDTPKGWKDLATVIIFFTLITFCVYILYMLALARRQRKELKDLRNAREATIDMAPNPLHDIEKAISENQLVQHFRNTSRSINAKLFQMLNPKKDKASSQENLGSVELSSIEKPEIHSRELSLKL
eukprot:g4214.t1